MGRDDLPDDHQAEAASRKFGGGKRLEDVDARRNAGTGVRNLQNDICPGTPGVECERTALGHRFDSVLAQIPESLL
jgi:hypothetical protein